MAALLDGKRVSESLVLGLKQQVQILKKKGRVPRLVILRVGENPASISYIRQKEKAARAVGIHSELFVFSAQSSESQLLKKIAALNGDPSVHGILVQLPLPKQIRSKKIIETIDPKKDVDAFAPVHLGNLISGNAVFTPCTPQGIIRLLDFYKIRIAGAHAVIVGRSAIVGKPLALMLLNRDATVTVCHTQTKKLSTHTKRADILVAACGNPRFIKASMVQKGAVVIDVGVNRIDGKLVGDVDFKSVSKKARFITPVPGGVGPMTVACLMKNTVEAAKVINSP